MIKKILMGIGAIIVAIIIVGALKPADYVVSREITVKAPPEKIFPYLNSTKLANEWAPWPDVDPQAKMNYSGPETGVGAQASWDSSGQLGTGSATITESVPNQRVALKLEYTKPMSMIQDAEYLMQTNGGETVVTWKVSGKNSLPGRVMCMFFNMDKMVGGMFETGLKKLKTIVEKK